MSDNIKILIVDDESFNREILEETFDEGYECISVENGQLAIDYLQDKSVDIILMDIKMPVMGGLEACKIIKENDTSYTPVIFISGLTNQSEIMAGYEAGGDDYISKPFDTDQLVKKVNSLITIKQKLTQKEQESSFANKMAMDIMTSSAESGNVVHFIRNTFSVKNFNELTESIIETLNSFDIKASLLINNHNNYDFLSLNSFSNPIEKQFLQLCYEKVDQKIRTISNKIIINNKNTTFCFKSLPKCEEKVGRYRDHLAIISDIVDSKVQQLLSEKKKNEYFEKLTQVLTDATDQIKHIDLSLENQGRLFVTSVNDFETNVENVFSTLGLDEDQEKILMETVHVFENDISELQNTNKEYNKKFKQIIDSIINLQKF